MAAPASPATFQPTRVASNTPGPGAARAMAKRSRKSRWLIQARASTAFWMPARMLGPPPIDSSDSGTKTSSNPANGLSRIPISRCQPGKGDTERGHRQHDRHHRPAQHADSEKDGKQNGQRPRAPLDASCRADADHHGE